LRSDNHAVAAVPDSHPDCNQSRRVPDATDQRGRPARLFLGCVKPDVVKLLQSRANWVSCLGVALLQC
ncbi:MAG TPA: hypothetical protein VNW89_18450, partial [Stellaceae bacterium]|nr:hypothetical protein [Stellaceae bacterium]